MDSIFNSRKSEYSKIFNNISNDYINYIEKIKRFLCAFYFEKLKNMIQYKGIYHYVKEK